MAQAPPHIRHHAVRTKIITSLGDNYKTIVFFLPELRLIHKLNTLFFTHRQEAPLISRLSSLVLRPSPFVKNLF